MNINGINIQTSLDNVFNKILVSFQEPIPQLDSEGLPTGNFNYVPAITDWMEDTYSQELFGAKEKIVGMGQGYESEAINKQRTFLNTSAYARITPDFGKEDYGVRTNSGKLELNGFYYALDYQYYSNTDTFTLDTFYQIENIISGSSYVNSVFRYGTSNIESIVLKEFNTTKLKDIQDLISLGTSDLSPIYIDYDYFNNVNIGKCDEDIEYFIKSNGDLFRNDGQQIENYKPIWDVLFSDFNNANNEQERTGKNKRS